MASRMWSIVTATLLLSSATAQTCYYAAGQQALAQYVPCSAGPNAAACCLAGDFCLADGACYSPSTSMTYIAGCTDSSFKDSSCRGGSTCNKNSQFQALALCGDNWICCGGQGQTGDIPSQNYATDCPCNSGYGTAIIAASTLPQFTSLPATFPTNQPSSSAAPSITPSSAATGSTQSTPSASGQSSTAAANTGSGGSGATSSQSAAGSSGTNAGAPSAVGQGVSPGSSSSGGSSTSLKVGLGVGIPLGLALVAVAGVGYWLWRRRQHAPQYVTQADLSTAVWQGESNGTNYGASEASAFHSQTNPTQYNGPKPSGGTAYAPMTQMDSPPQYKPVSGKP